MDVLSTTIASLVWGAPWIAGVAIGWIAYGRRKSTGLRLALTAFASLFVLHIFSSIVIIFLPLYLKDVGWSIGTTTQTLDGISLFFQLGRTGLVVLLAIAYFRLLQENHIADSGR